MQRAREPKLKEEKQKPGFILQNLGLTVLDNENKQQLQHEQLCPAPCTVYNQ